MDIYNLLSSAFPRSFMAKILFVMAVGAILPAVAIAGAVLLLPGDTSRAGMAALCAAAILGGWGIAALAMLRLMEPVRLMDVVLTDLAERRHPSMLPEGYTDAPGRMMAQINRMIMGMERRVALATASEDLDSMTNVLNRQGFERVVPDPLSGAILCLDPDRFDNVNTRFGRAAGDIVLRELARVLAATVRDDDVVGRHDGATFTLYLANAREAAALAVADRIRREVERRLRVKGQMLTVSVGAALSTVPASREALVVEAQAALSEAKAAGRNRVVLAGRENAAEAA